MVKIVIISKLMRSVNMYCPYVNCCFFCFVFCTVWSTLIRISLTKALVLWWCDNKSDFDLIWRMTFTSKWFCTHTHTHTHTQTHTHTHVGFYGLRGLSIGVMVFILYKLYVLLPYTYPTPKLSPHRRRCISTSPPKNALCMIYKHFKLWGHWKCPHKSPSPCNTYVIPMSLYKFVSS